MSATFNYRGQSFTASQMLQGTLLAFPCIWLVAFLVLLATDFRQAPRQAATLLALTYDSVPTTGTITGFAANSVKGKTNSVDVTYAFQTRDGTTRTQTQRIPFQSWQAMPSTNQALTVRYSPQMPSLSTIDSQSLRDFLLLSIKLPLVFPIVLLSCGFLFWGPVVLFKLVREKLRNR